jgi:pyrroline-5-carboxylate reductase
MNVAIIGTGKMGSSLARGIASGSLQAVGAGRQNPKGRKPLRKIAKGMGENAELILCGRKGAKELARELGAREASAREAARKADVIIVAVKPKDVEGLLGEIKEELHGKLLLSVAAGLPESYFRKRVPKGCRIALAMPNLAVAHGKGATAYFARGRDAAPVARLLGRTGILIRVKDERLMDCAFISSSGIAFFFSAIGAMARAAERHGMERQDALLLAAAAAEGAGAMAREASAKELEKRVATKKGITEHGLKVLKKAGVKRHFHNAAHAVIREAKRRRKRNG